MVPEARLEQTEAGLVPAGDGWFVLNAREARWRHREGRGDSLPLTGWTDGDRQTRFPQLGHGAGVQQETSDPGEAYARFPDPEPTAYRDGWLPGG